MHVMVSAATREKLDRIARDIQKRTTHVVIPSLVLDAAVAAFADVLVERMDKPAAPEAPPLMAEEYYK